MSLLKQRVRKKLRYDTELLKVAAVNKALMSLGEHSYYVLSEYLMQVKGISIEAIEGEGSYTLAQLKEALEKLLGANFTNMMMERIFLLMNEFVEEEDKLIE